jgi:hypothetical protein
MEGRESMDEKEKLSVVIEHWIEHNESHLGEYRKWAQRAGEMGLSAVKGEIDEAIEMLSKLNGRLDKALNGLKTTGS